MTAEEQIAKALEIGVRYGGFDGAHHKAWVIDQMIRALTDSPIETHTTADCNGNTYTYERLGESEKYKEIVRESCDGEDGPNTYEWDTGIAP